MNGFDREELVFRAACEGGECVEVAEKDGVWCVRDSKDATGPVLRFTTAEWAAFIWGVKLGEFDVR
ncbi:hypothetical protein Sme01_46030 [Sphaerisporangium melleum]|uniref:DUF397 domain-containing protein n=1 Tax=Sphaerisporangium melleum TaxID=321316 RepID=A0A917QZ24_9ACTN|nr:DUF397 domain-containing protein [Sphaerisporangium melleum]GGK79807.1 hypothetical protein GCM10007964_23050 [Sphaerisporangium melleum]GII72127.1 hypothetical protein Sme01_46030 [Sphaerisporangium melleum]